MADVVLSNGGVMNVQELKKMTFQQIAALEASSRNVRREEFYDTLVVRPNAAGSPYPRGLKHKLFRKGYDEQDFVLGAENDPTGQYQKLKDLHTNMVKNGEFPNNAAFVVTSIECPFMATAGVKAGVVNGIITDPAITASSNYDPAVLADAWLDQNKISIRQGEGEPKVVGLLREFPAAFGLSGAYGAATGGFVQNTGFENDNSPLLEPLVLSGGEDFFVEFETLAPSFNLATINQHIRQRIVFKGIYVYDVQR